MTAPLSPGDRVVCVDAEEHHGGCVEGFHLVLGAEYTVDGIILHRPTLQVCLAEDTIRVTTAIDGDRRYWRASRFRKIEPEPESIEALRTIVEDAQRQARETPAVLLFNALNNTPQER